MSTKDKNYKEFYKNCLACQRCPLRKSATQVVPGKGNINSSIMFIGEAPGAKEDQTGEPFVGSAGKFLDVMLASIDLRREDIYIANMLKCRPPQNREPEDFEKETCRNWLDTQIEIINPKIFIPLGRHALGKFVPGIQISKAHGKFFICEVNESLIKGKIVFASYHPAVALYNGSMRNVLLEDFKNLKKIIEKI